MTTHIIVNGREITNPFARALLAIGAIITAGIIAAFLVFVLLPLIGIAVSLSIGFVLIIIAAMFVAAAVMALGTYLFGWLFGPAELRIDKQRKEQALKRNQSGNQ